MRNIGLAVLILAAVFIRRELFSVMTRGLHAPAPAVSSSIPADFPSDVPIPANAKCEESTKMSGMTRVALRVDQDASGLLRFYEAELPAQGWIIGRMGDELKDGAGEEGFVGEKNGRSLSAVIVSLQDGRSEVTLTAN